ncbi:DHA2 family efflux MFS transporter permease subunit [Actinomadura sp. 6N118]|uniref:DHA2 family efflux MFS transporter permease subunit n=1 Tax=Actinomadura sp. 6N118 TaxID=3375151 RepID=UPI0037A609B9
MTHDEDRLRWLIGVILLGGIMGILDGTMVAVAADTLTVEFGSSLSAVGWVSTGYLLTLTVTIPVTGWAVGRFGAKRLWLAGLLLFLAGSLASGMAWNVGSLIVFRVVQGLGAGILDPLVLVLLARAAGPARAGRVMGTMAAVLSLGPVLGPVVGGLVLDGLGWRWMFLINLPIGMAAFLLALRLIPADEPATRRTPLDVVGLALLGPGFAAAGLALSQTAEQARFTTWQTLTPLAVSLVLLAAYAPHALRSRSPLVDLRLFGSRGFAASVGVMALTGVAMYTVLFVLPLHFQQQGHGALTAGLLVAPLGLGAAAASPIAGRFSDRIGGRTLVRAGALAATAGTLALIRVGPDDPVRWPALAGLVIGLGLGCVGAPTMGALYRTLPAPLVPQGSSVLYMLNQLGASAGIAVVALIIETVGPSTGFHRVAVFGAAVTAVILLAAALLPGRPAPEFTNPPAEAVTEGALR